MKSRGADHAFILYGYSIFLARSSDDADKKSVSPYLKRARNSEEIYRKRHSDGCQYDVADIGFYRHAALSQQTGGAWENYGLCR
jgi:hypothetical protein